MSTNSKLKLPLSSEHSYNLSKQNFLAKNIIFISHIPESLFSKDILYQKKFLGQYGHINQMILLNHKNEKNVIVQFDTVNQAALAILSLQNFKIDNERKLKAIYFTTKYCYYYLNNKECPNPNCLFLHENNVNNYLLLELKNNKYIDSLKFALDVLNLSKQVFEAIYIKLIGDNYYETQKKFPKMTMKKIKNDDFIKSLYPIIKENNINKRKNNRKFSKKKNENQNLKYIKSKSNELNKSNYSNDSNCENLESIFEDSKSNKIEKINLANNNNYNYTNNFLIFKRSNHSRFDFVKKLKDNELEKKLRIIIPDYILHLFDKCITLIVNKNLINDDNENNIKNINNKYCHVDFNSNWKNLIFSDIK